MCVSTIIPLFVSTDTTIPSTTTTHTITGIDNKVDNKVDNSNTYYTVMTTTIDQSTVSLCVVQVDDKILDRESLIFLLIV